MTKASPPSQEELQAQLHAAYAAHVAGRLPEAEQLYRFVLEYFPAHPEVRQLFGALLLQMGRQAEGMQWLSALLEEHPNHLGALTNLALAKAEAGQLDEAFALLDRALALDPDNAETVRSQSQVLLQADRHDEALAKLSLAQELDPRRLPLWLDLRVIYLVKAGRLAEAIEHTYRWATYPGQELPARVARMAAYFEADMIEQGRELLDTIDEQACDPVSLAKVVHAHARLWQLDEAVRLGDAVLAQMPQQAKAHFTLGYFLLLNGDLQRGWEEIAWRFKSGDVRQQVVTSLPEWQGEQLQGQGVLVHSEQGIGDVLQFMRYFPLMQARGAKVIFAGYQDVLTLMKHQGDAQTLDAAAVDLSYDYHIPLLDLGRIFSPDLASIPANVPYIQPSPTKSEIWAQTFAAQPGLRVGLVWAGNPAHGNDHRRSMNLEDLAPLAGVPGVRFFSLQKGPGESEALRAPLGMTITNLSASITDFSDTAAIIANLDLVICVDTSVAHLAGAMGRPVWLLLPPNPDWRWLMDRDDTPWYPTMRLFRRKPSEGWRDLAPRVADALNALVRQTLPDGDPHLGLARALAELPESAQLVQFMQALSKHAQLAPSLSNPLGAALAAQSDSEWFAPYADRLQPLDRARLQAAWMPAQALDIWKAAWESSSAIDAFRRYANTLVQATQADPLQALLSAPPDGLERNELTYLQAQAHRLADRKDEAEQGYRAVLAAHRRHVGALTNLAVVLSSKEKVDEARQYAQTAVSIDPSHLTALTTLVRQLYVSQMPNAAWDILRHALRLHPDDTMLLHFAGATAYDLGESEVSREYYERLLHSERLNVRGRYTYALALAECEEPAQAQSEALWDELRDDPDIGVHSRFAHGLYLLKKQTDPARGWALWEARLEFPRADKIRSETVPRWDGTPLAGRRLLVYCEQGLGDEIQILPHAAAIEGETLIVCRDSLLPLFSLSYPNHRFIPRGKLEAGLAEVDCYIEAMSLPHEQGYGAQLQRPVGAYLKVAPSVMPAPDMLLTPPGIKRVGLVWGGNPAHRNDRFRSCRLHALLSLFEVDGIAWYSLQKDSPSNEAYFLPEGVPLNNLAIHANSLSETACLIEQLDLVISVDSALAHLASALGKPVWMLLPKRVDWRWGETGERTAWYPDMRLFRQDTLGEWQAPVQALKAALEQWVAQGRMP